ncbi:MAG: M67 family metallopeptidase [Nitrospirae bacterium]|nr:M67 family metallopeptidase [Nitrospirota bacterium]
MLKVPSNISSAMLEHAKTDFPLECCGILGGKGDEATHIYRMRNIDKSKVTYLMDPAEQMKVFKEMRSLGIELKAIYHSHPNHPALPSRTDVELAYYPEAVYIIISINDSKETKIGSFNIVDKNITIAEIDIQ